MKLRMLWLLPLIAGEAALRANETESKVNRAPQESVTSSNPANPLPKTKSEDDKIPLDPKTEALKKAIEAAGVESDAIYQRISKIRKAAFYQLRHTKNIPSKLENDYTQLENDFSKYLRFVESFLDKNANTEKILAPQQMALYSNIIFATAINLIEIGSLKGIISTRQSESDMELWIRRFSVSFPIALSEVSDEIVQSLSNRWGKRYSNFISSREDETHTRFMLNPNYLAFASMGYRFQREVSDEEFLALTQYFSTDQLQAAWQNIQYYLNEELTPLNYPDALLENIRSLGLSKWISKVDQNEVQRSNAIKLILETLKKRQNEFGTFHSDAYYQKILEAFRVSDLGANQDFIGNGIVKLMKEKEGRANPVLYTLISQSAWDPTINTPKEIDEKLKTFIVRSRVATDVSIIEEFVRNLREISDTNIPEKFRSVSKESYRNGIKVVFDSAADYFAATEKLSFNLTKADFEADYRARHDRIIISYAQTLLRASGSLSSHVQEVDYSALKEALKVRLGKIVLSSYIQGEIEKFTYVQKPEDANKLFAAVNKKIEKEISDLEKQKPNGGWFSKSTQGIDSETYNTLSVSLKKDQEDWKKVGSLFGVGSQALVATMLLSQEEYVSYRKYLENQTLGRLPVLAIPLNYKGGKTELWRILYDITKGSTRASPKSLPWIYMALKEAKNNLLQSWKTVTEAKDYKDIDMLVKSPLFHAGLKAAFPEYEEVRLEVLGGLSMENFYQRFISKPISATSQFVVFPVFLMNVANYALSKVSGDSLSPGGQFLARYLIILYTLKAAQSQQGLIGSLADTWRSSTPSFFWLFFYGDFATRESMMVAENGIGFSMQETNEGLRITEPKTLRDGRTFFLSSALGSPLIDKQYFEGTRKAYFTKLSTVYFQLAFDTWIASNISRAVIQDLRSRNSSSPGAQQ